MSFNLLELAKDQITGQLVKHATGALGESEGAIQKAMGGILPSILGSVIGKASDEEGASGIMDMLKGVDPGMLGDMGGLMSSIGEDKPDGIMNIGQGLLGGLMGNKLGGAVDLISKFSGIKSGSAMSLFKMATPFLMGMIGKKITSDGGGVSGLMSMLGDQKDAVAKALPAGMGSLMGLGSLMGGASDMATGALAGVASTTKNVSDGARAAASSAATTATATVSAAAETTKKGGMSLFKWLIPALLGLAVVYFLTQSEMCKNTTVGDAVGSTIESGTDAAKDAGNAMADGAKNAGGAMADGAAKVGAGLSAAFSSVNEAGKSALASIKFGANSAGQQMMSYIDGGGETGDGSFRFTNLNFESGSARIAGTSGSEVDNLAAILTAYPDVKVKIAGHTDSDGDADANMTLSEARANAVKARLGAQGIDGSRVMTEGFGETNPVADNGTAEGKAQNRRIEVQIVE